MGKIYHKFQCFDFVDKLFCFVGAEAQWLVGMGAHRNFSGLGQNPMVAFNISARFSNAEFDNYFQMIAR